LRVEAQGFEQGGHPSIIAGRLGNSSYPTSGLSQRCDGGAPMIWPETGFRSVLGLRSTGRYDCAVGVTERRTYTQGHAQRGD
jgi:hypothetical protein